MKFSIPHNNRWLRPDKAFFDSVNEAKSIDPKELEWNGKYKRIREQRDIAIFGMCLSELHRRLFYVQMNSLSSSPDAFVIPLPENNSATLEVGPVEITFYGSSRIGPPKESLAERLGRKKGKFYKLPPGYCLLIHIGLGLKINHEAVVSLLEKFRGDFQIFSVQETSSYPDTKAQVASYKPKLSFKEINVGKACHEMRELKAPHILNQIYGTKSHNNQPHNN